MNERKFTIFVSCTQRKRNTDELVIFFLKKRINLSLKIWMDCSWNHRMREHRYRKYQSLSYLLNRVALMPNGLMDPNQEFVRSPEISSELGFLDLLNLA